MTPFRVIAAVLSLIVVHAGTASAAWDGSTTLHDIHLKPENFLDINSYQFRPSEDIQWYDVENGWRVAGGSLESNRAYLFTDMRLKRPITPNFNARLRWTDEEFYAPHEPERPLLELELQPTAEPVTFSLLGAPAYAKREADLGLAASLGVRPWDYVRVAWLRPDYYYNRKNDLDNSYYRRAPGQLTAEAAYKWGEDYKLRLLWQDDRPLEFVLDEAGNDDLLIFQLDLFNARGPMPRTLLEVDERTKDIRYSSRTRMNTDVNMRMHKSKAAMRSLLASLPNDFDDREDVAYLREMARENAVTVVQLIYRKRPYEGGTKDYEFSRQTMLEHWASGIADAERCALHKDRLLRRIGEGGVMVIDPGLRG